MNAEEFVKEARKLQEQQDELGIKGLQVIEDMAREILEKDKSLKSFTMGKGGCFFKDHNNIMIYDFRSCKELYNFLENYNHIFCFSMHGMIVELGKGTITNW